MALTQLLHYIVPGNGSLLLSNKEAFGVVKETYYRAIVNRGHSQQQHLSSLESCRVNEAIKVLRCLICVLINQGLLPGSWEGRIHSHDSAELRQSRDHLQPLLPEGVPGDGRLRPRCLLLPNLKGAKIQGKVTRTPHGMRKIIPP